MYSEKVMDHFKNPRNVGEIPDADGIGEVGNPVCGDTTKIYLKIEGNVINDIKFKTFGCGAAIASSSMLTEMAKGSPSNYRSGGCGYAGWPPAPKDALFEHGGRCHA